MSIRWPYISTPLHKKSNDSRVCRVSKRIRSIGLCTVYIEAGLRVRISTATISAATNKPQQNRPSCFHAQRQNPYTHKTNICRTPFHDGHAHARAAGAGAATADATSASTSVDDLTITAKGSVLEPKTTGNEIENGDKARTSPSAHPRNKYPVLPHTANIPHRAATPPRLFTTRLSTHRDNIRCCALMPSALCGCRVREISDVVGIGGGGRAPWRMRLGGIEGAEGRVGRWKAFTCRDVT
jgi:hypothetical protein